MIGFQYVLKKGELVLQKLCTVLIAGVKRVVRYCFASVETIDQVYIGILPKILLIIISLQQERP